MVTLRAFSNPQALLQLATQYPDLDLSSLETCLVFLTTTSEVYEAFDAHFNRYGLSMGKFTLMMHLLQAAGQGLTPSECADRARVTRATVTGLLDGLERNGLVKRKPDASDRRMLRVELTQSGRELLTRMLPDHFCRTQRMLVNLTASEKKLMVKLLNKLRSGTRAMLEP